MNTSRHRNSPSDKLVINAGSASGSSFLGITNAGGPGAMTTGSGILVVDATNGGTTSAGAFAVNGIVAAGPYEYQLFRGGAGGASPNSWFLRNTVELPVTPELPVPPGVGPTPPDPTQPIPPVTPVPPGAGPTPPGDHPALPSRGGALYPTARRGAAARPCNARDLPRAPGRSVPPAWRRFAPRLLGPHLWQAC